MKTELEFLEDLRDEFYNDMPVGDIDAFDHEFDEFCSDNDLTEEKGYKLIMGDI